MTAAGFGFTAAYTALGLDAEIAVVAGALLTVVIGIYAFHTIKSLIK